MTKSSHDSAGRPQVTRRTLAAGAAWAVPTAAVLSPAPALAASVDLVATAKFRAMGDCGGVAPSYNNLRSQITFNVSGGIGGPPVTERDAWSFTSATNTAPTSVCVEFYYPKCYNNVPAFSRSGFTALTQLADTTLNGQVYYAYRSCQVTASSGWIYNSTTQVWAQSAGTINFNLSIGLSSLLHTCASVVPAAPWSPCPCNLDWNLDLFVKRTVVQAGDNYVSWGSVPNAPCTSAVHF